MNYWIIVNGTQLGPMDLAQLINTPGFGPATPVWRDGLADWTTAAQLPETAVLFGRQQPLQQQKPPTYLVWAIIATLCCCLPGGIVALIYSSRVSQLYYSGDYEGARRASDRAGMWVIISFVIGIICIPFSILWSLLTM